MGASTTAALTTFGTVFGDGLDAIVPAIVATIQPFWVQLVVIGVVVGLIGGALSYILPRRGLRFGKRVKI